MSSFRKRDLDALAFYCGFPAASQDLANAVIGQTHHLKFSSLIFHLQADV
jgi:hypothetical protein